MKATIVRRAHFQPESGSGLPNMADARGYYPAYGTAAILDVGGVHFLSETPNDKEHAAKINEALDLDII